MVFSWIPITGIVFIFFDIRSTIVAESFKRFIIDEDDLNDAKIKVTSNMNILRRSYFQTNNLVCQYPNLHIDNPEVWKHLHPVKKSRPDCEQDENWVYVKNGTFRISEKAEKNYGPIKCRYYPIIRGKDDFSKKRDAPIFPYVDRMPLVSDFFQAECIGKNNRSYSNFHMGIKYDPVLHVRHIQNPMSKTHLSYHILMFGFDSTSRMTFMRLLPKTYSYLVKELGAIVMKGYNIVGDGTPAALFPILTGQTERELPESRRGYPNASTVDKFPWIWNNFKNNGYVVQWAEDMQTVGTFQYRLKGFRDPPVDHFGRPFYLYAEAQKSKNWLCFGSITRLQAMFDWIREFFDMYSNQPKFSYLFHSHYSHDSNHRIPYADDELLAFLKMMHTDGYLDHTMLVIMTDHGARYTSLRRTYQGKMEERLPFMSIRMPPKFQAEYPAIMKNLRLNSHRLTTPFDIHETFEHLFDFHSPNPYQSKSNRSYSLFELVPENRTCAEAHVKQHWCACLDWRAVSINVTIVQQFSLAAIDFLNQYVSDHKDECAKLSLFNVSKASQLYLPHHDSKSVNQSNEHNTSSRFQLNPLRPTLETNFYQIEFETIPGNGQFELTAEYEPKKGTFDIQKRYLSRVNKYGNAPACVAEKRPDFREICYCSNLLHNTTVSV